MDGRRERFLDEIRRDGVEMPPPLAAAFASVPREVFVPDGFQRRDGRWSKPGHPDFLDLVYRDDALITKLNGGVPTSSSSQPSLMAIMLATLDVRPGMRVLEIGAGTGYNSALLATLGAEVTSVDVQADVADRARSALARAGIDGVRVVHGDGYAGFPGVRFDRVIVTVGVAGISPRWLDGLAPDGVLVAPVEHAGTHPVLAVRPPGEATGHSTPDRAGPDSPGPDRAGPDRPGSDGAGSDRAGPDRSGPDRVTASLVCPAGFMTASGPLTATHPGSFPAPAAPGTLTGLVERAGPRFAPQLDSMTYRDLWYAAGVWHRRATHAAVPHREQSCLVLLDEARSGGAVIPPDGSVLAAGPDAETYAQDAVALLDRWIAAGRPPMQAWRIGLDLSGDPAAPIWVPSTWELPA